MSSKSVLYIPSDTGITGLFDRFSEALDLYDELLEKEPTSLAVMKRKVAIHKAMGDNNRAITELVKILET